MLTIKTRTTIAALAATLAVAVAPAAAPAAIKNDGQPPSAQRPVGPVTQGPILGSVPKVDMPKDAGSAGQPGYGDSECAMLLRAWRSARQKWLDAAAGSAAESDSYDLMVKIWRLLNDRCMIVMD
jgi:hypothetical protein